MRVITGILAVLALLLSGCSETADPTMLPTQPPLATSATGPTPLESADSTGAPDSETDDPVGSEVLELVDEYMAATEDSIRSRDALDRRETLFGASCSVCQDGADAARAILDSGLAVKGGSVTHNAEVLGYENGIALVQVTHQIGAIRLLDADGEEVESAPASDPIDQVFQIARQEDGQWLVLSVQTLS